ncbi:hypothetical protein BDR26DRAFT_851909 [Obelidium mucronatum]|nr:hypothetical protein BDR26DRAFT_851909 [Obelidium mucronatum]
MNPIEGGMESSTAAPLDRGPASIKDDSGAARTPQPRPEALGPLAHQAQQQLLHPQQQQPQQQQPGFHHDSQQGGSNGGRIRSHSVNTQRPEFHPYHVAGEGLSRGAVASTFDSAGRRRTHSMTNYSTVPNNAVEDDDSRFPPSPRLRDSFGSEFGQEANVPTPAESKRLNYSPEIRAILLSWLGLNREYPYPTDADKNDLAAKTGLTLQQVNNWFINARRRKYQYMLEDVNVKGNPSPVPPALPAGAHMRATISAGSSSTYSPLSDLDRRMALSAVGPGRRRAFSGNAASALASTPPSHSPYWKTAAESLSHQQHRPGFKSSTLYNVNESPESNSNVRVHIGGGYPRLTQNSPLQHVYQLEQNPPVVIAKGPSSSSNQGVRLSSNNDRKQEYIRPQQSFGHGQPLTQQQFSQQPPHQIQPQHLNRQSFHLTPYNLASSQQPYQLSSSPSSNSNPYRGVPQTQPSYGGSNVMNNTQSIASNASHTNSVSQSLGEDGGNLPQPSTMVKSSPTTMAGVLQSSPLRNASFPHQQQQQHTNGVHQSNTSSVEYIHSGPLRMPSDSSSNNIHSQPYHLPTPGQQLAPTLPPLQQQKHKPLESMFEKLSTNHLNGPSKDSGNVGGGHSSPVRASFTGGNRSGGSMGLEALVEAAVEQPSSQLPSSVHSQPLRENDFQHIQQPQQQQEHHLSGSNDNPVSIEQDEDVTAMDGIVMETERSTGNDGGVIRETAESGDTEYAAKQVSMRWKERDAIWGI